MSFLDSVLGSSSDSDPASSNPAVPGGISKPLMIALLALLARYMTSGSAASRDARHVSDALVRLACCVLCRWSLHLIGRKRH